MELAPQFITSDLPPARHAAPATSDDAQKSPRQPLRVVICDDDKDSVDTLAVILEDEGHKVERIYAGQEVMGTVRRVEPHAVICDISMPNMTGYDVIKAIRSQIVTYRPLFIAVSGVYVRPADALIAQALGFDHHLTKPVHPDELIRVLETLQRKPR